jgi:hypothetical protein
MRTRFDLKPFETFVFDVAGQPHRIDQVLILGRLEPLTGGIYICRLPNGQHFRLTAERDVSHPDEPGLVGGVGHGWYEVELLDEATALAEAETMTPN